MAYTQTPGFPRQMATGITELISQLQSKDNSDGSTTGTSAKPAGQANTVQARNLNFKPIKLDKGGTESMVNQETGEEVVTTSIQRAANKAAASNNLRGELTGNTTFDNTTGNYSPAPYKGKKLKGDDGILYGYKSHSGKVTKFTGMTTQAKIKAKKEYEKDQKNYMQKASQATDRFNIMANTHNSQQ